MFATALQWLQGALLGTVATSIAVIAIASVGFLLLSGRIDIRRAVQAVVGCFILFGASSIAAGVAHAISGSGETPEVVTPPPPVPFYAAQPLQPVHPAAPYDPYAGAAMPARR